MSDGAAEGDYTIDVVNAGVYATSMSSSNWNGGADSTRTYQLSLGGVNYALSPADNSAASVVSAINSSYGDKVHATLVNVGSSATPDYRISLQAVKLGDLKARSAGRFGKRGKPSNPADQGLEHTRHQPDRANLGLQPCA